MTSGLYDRIQMLCDERRISIAQLEKQCGFANATIKKWQNASTPGVDKVIAIAKYFNVSTDYLLGRTDIPSRAEEIIADEDIITLQRAKDRMTVSDLDKMMKMLRIGFDYAFQDDKSAGRTED